MKAVFTLPTNARWLTEKLRRAEVRSCLWLSWWVSECAWCWCFYIAPNKGYMYFRKGAQTATRLRPKRCLRLPRQTTSATACSAWSRNMRRHTAQTGARTIHKWDVHWASFLKNVPRKCWWRDTVQLVSKNAANTTQPPMLWMGGCLIIHSDMRWTSQLVS